jgi:hypoxanthine phosphoribosyltransferase
VSEFQPPVIIPAAAIADRVDDLARRISHDHAGVEDLLMVGVLRGSYMFLADLTRRLTVPCSVDFISLTEYDRGSLPSGSVRLALDLRVDIRGRHVVLVEDIVSSGCTLAYLVKTFELREPASVRTCVLARKRGHEHLAVRLDYVGFDVPDRWVVGYGLDYDNKYRTFPYIGVVHAPDTEIDAEPLRQTP